MGQLVRCRGWQIGFSPAKNTPRLELGRRGGRRGLLRIGQEIGRICVRGRRQPSTWTPARFGRFAGGSVFVVVRPAAPVSASGRKRRDRKAKGRARPRPDTCESERRSCPGVSLGGNGPSQGRANHSADQGMAGAWLRLPHLRIAMPTHRTARTEGRAGAPVRELGHRGVVDRAARRVSSAAWVDAVGISRVGAARRGDRTRGFVSGRGIVSLRQRVRSQQDRGHEE